MLPALSYFAPPTDRTSRAMILLANDPGSPAG